MTTPVIRDFSSNFSTTSTLVLTIPAGTLAGDYLAMFVAGPTTVSTPSGWTLAQSLNTPNQIYAFRRRAQAGDAGTTVSFTLTATQAHEGSIVAVAAASNHSLNTSNSTGPSVITSNVASITTTTGDLVLMFGYVRNSSITITSSGKTALVQRNTDTGGSLYVGYNTAASTGTQTNTMTVSATGGSGYSSAVFSFTDTDLTASTGSAGSLVLSTLIASTGSSGSLVVLPSVTGSTGASGSVVAVDTRLIASTGASGSTDAGIALLTGSTGASGQVVSYVLILGATATSTQAAPAASALTLTTPPSVITTSPARIYIDAQPPDAVEVVDKDIYIEAPTAILDAYTPEGTVFFGGGKVGDLFSNPVLVAGSGGTASFDFTGTTVEADEPVPTYPSGVQPGDPGTILQQTMWVKYTANANGTLTITGSTAGDSYEIEVFEGSTLSTLSLAEKAYYSISTPSLTPTITHAAVTDTATYVRVWPSGTSPGSSSPTVGFTLTPDPEQAGSLQIDLIEADFPTSPAVIRFDVVGGTPEGDLQFDLLGTSAAWTNPPGVTLGSNIATFTADTSGNLYGTGVPLPAVSAGTYTLRVTDLSSDLVASASIQVEADPVAAPSTAVPDAPVGSVSHGTTVKYWVLKDPFSGGLGTYVVPINPSQMSSPHAPRNVTFDRLVGVDAGDLIWEGAYRANEWHFSGSSLTQAHYEQLVAFAGLNRRFWIIDHRDRAWVCSIESIGWTKLKAPYNDWAWSYDVTALIYQGPVDVS